MRENNTFVFEISIYVLIGWLTMDGEIAGFLCLGLAHGLAVVKSLF